MSKKEIQVTDDMIEAGTSAIIFSMASRDSYAEIAKNVYMAMEKKKCEKK